MHGSKQDLSVSVDVDGVTIREAEWGAFNAAIETFPAGLVTAPLFTGLPDDRCQCEHWGYVLKGQFRIIYKDREETVTVGDAYWMSPGHSTAFDQDTEVVEFSPRGDYQQTLEVAARNMAAMHQA